MQQKKQKRKKQKPTNAHYLIFLGHSSKYAEKWSAARNLERLPHSPRLSQPVQLCITSTHTSGSVSKTSSRSPNRMRFFWISVLRVGFCIKAANDATSVTEPLPPSQNNHIYYHWLFLQTCFTSDCLALSWLRPV